MCSPGAVWGCWLPGEVELDFVSGSRQMLSRNLNVDAMQRGQRGVCSILKLGRACLMTSGAATLGCKGAGRVVRVERLCTDI